MQSTLAALEWDKVLRLVAAFARTSAGRKEVLQAVPEFGAGAQKAYQLARDVIALTASYGTLPLAGLEASAFVESPSSSWEGKDLVPLVTLVWTIVETRRIVLAEGPGPALAELCQSLPDLAGFFGWCEQRLARDGTIPDSASPSLAQLRRSREHLRSSIRQRLEELSKQYPFASGPYTLRRERFCFPIPASERARVSGFVLDASGSGATVFVEPFPLVELNNSLTQVEAQIREEEQRILAELTAAFLQKRAQLLQACQILAKLDAFQARVLYGKATGSTLLPPANGTTLKVVGARHPLLDPVLAPLRAEVLGEAGNRHAVVPTYLDFPTETRLIVVSGPNAGGKTVVLKTVGLLVLMAAAGIPVLALPETVLPNVSGVFCHIGDEQNVLGELSTFQAAVQATAQLLTRTDEALLVLYDEIGSGTDPEEGQALAAALLEELARRRWWTLATSHLTSLAPFVETLPGGANAAMGFDEATGRPTYQLSLGRPGRSRGLALARACGLPEPVITRALSLLSQGYLTLTSYLARLEEQSRDLANAKNQLVETEKALRAAERAALEQAQNLTTKERELRVILQQEVAKLRQQAEERWARVLRELEAAKQNEQKLGRRKLARLRADALTLELSETPSKVPEAKLNVGAVVLVQGLSGEGKVLQLRGNQVEIAIAGKRLWVEKSSCTPVNASSPQTELAVEAGSTPKELVLVGLDREAAREQLEKFLDSALVHGYRHIRIVHGHGTGTLRRTVWEVLKTFPGVVNWVHPPQFRGGTGVTEVELEG